MGQRVLTAVGLVVVLVALGWVSVPFNDGHHSCDPAAVSAIHGSGYTIAAVPAKPGPLIDFGPPVGTLRGASIPAVPAQSFVWCMAPARGRVATSAIIIGLTLVGVVVGRRILATPRLESTSSA